MVFAISSPAFKNGETIPMKFTADGEDVSPILVWTNPPHGTKSYALICDDPDAPMGTWTHWVIFNIPGGNIGLPEAVPVMEKLPDGARQGLNSWRRIGYGGPSPPPGDPHRYFFKLYALDDELRFPASPDNKALSKAMVGRILGQTEFHGTYGRRR